MKVIAGVFAIITVLVLAGIAYLSMYRPIVRNTAPTKTGMNNIQPTRSAEDTVMSFYKIYEDCLKNPPAAAGGQVSVYCQENTGLTSSNFSSNLQSGGTAKAGADPIVCAQNLPEKVDINTVTSEKETGRVVVSESFGASSLLVPLALKIEDSVWKIDNIFCPLPTGTKDNCPCWDSRNNICLPLSACQ